MHPPHFIYPDAGLPQDGPCYRGTSLIRNTTLLGPYSRTTVVLGWRAVSYSAQPPCPPSVTASVEPHLSRATSPAKPLLTGQGYLAHKETPSPVTYPYAKGPTIVVGWGAISYERGTPLDSSATQSSFQKMGGPGTDITPVALWVPRS